VPGCPLYPGLTCEQHRAIPGQCRNPPEGMPKLESTNLMPNSWFVTPDGTVEQIEASAQQVSGKIEDLVTEMEKDVGKPLKWKKYKKYLAAFQSSDTALADGKLKDAIKALQKVEKDTKKLPEGMKTEVTKRVDVLNAKAEAAFTAIKDGADETAAKLKAAGKLKSTVGLRFKRGYLPVVDEIKAWIKTTKAAAK